MVLRWLNRGLCNGHDYGSWCMVDADPAFRRRMGGIFGRSDWKTYFFPCHEFRKCRNCGDVEVREVHSWGGPETVSGTSFRSVDDNTGHKVTSKIRRCVRYGCGATQRC